MSPIKIIRSTLPYLFSTKNLFNFFPCTLPAPHQCRNQYRHHITHSTEMQALTFHSTYNIIHTSTPRPRLCSPTDAIVRIRFAGLCGSDLHIYRGTEPGPDKGTIMGHEFVGVVAEIGSKVVGIQVGDRVGGAFTTCCGEVRKGKYYSHRISIKFSYMSRRKISFDFTIM